MVAAIAAMTQSGLYPERLWGSLKRRKYPPDPAVEHRSGVKKSGFPAAEGPDFCAVR